MIDQAVVLCIRAPRAVVPADLPVLFGILDDGFAGFKHNGKGGNPRILDLFVFPLVIRHAGRASVHP